MIFLLALFYPQYQNCIDAFSVCQRFTTNFTIMFYFLKQPLINCLIRIYSKGIVPVLWVNLTIEYIIFKFSNFVVGISILLCSKKQIWINSYNVYVSIYLWIMILKTRDSSNINRFKSWFIIL
jgi:hypothetical protein